MSHTGIYRIPITITYVDIPISRNFIASCVFSFKEGLDVKETSELFKSEKCDAMKSYPVKDSGKITFG